MGLISNFDCGKMEKQHDATMKHLHAILKSISDTCNDHTHYWSSTYRLLQHKVVVSKVMSPLRHCEEFLCFVAFLQLVNVEVPCYFVELQFTASCDHISI